jgi:hypothetical protein
MGRLLCALQDSVTMPHGAIGLVSILVDFPRDNPDHAGKRIWPVDESSDNLDYIRAPQAASLHDISRCNKAAGRWVIKVLSNIYLSRQCGYGNLQHMFIIAYGH